MEALVVLLVAGVVLSPIVLSIAAFVRSGSARREIEKLNQRIAVLEAGRGTADRPQAAPLPAVAAPSAPAPVAPGLAAVPALREAVPGPVATLAPPPLPQLSAAPPATTPSTGPGSK